LPVIYCDQEDGKVHALVRDRHRSREFIEFLKLLDTAYPAHKPSEERNPMSIGTILLIIVVIALLGGFSGIGGGRFYGTGYYGGGGLGPILCGIRCDADTDSGAKRTAFR
jgi:hypothetical protein